MGSTGSTDDFTPPAGLSGGCQPGCTLGWCTRPHMYKVGVYMKFYETKINVLEKYWGKFIAKCLPHNVPVFIWIESDKPHDKPPLSTQLPQVTNLPHVRVITHANKNKYCPDIKQKEQRLDTIMAILGFTFQHPHAHAHAKSWFLTQDCHYILHLDADDHPHEWLLPEHLQTFVDHLENKDVRLPRIITRPCHRHVGRGWSFGFTFQEYDVLDKLQLLTRERDSAELHAKLIFYLPFIHLNMDIFIGYILEYELHIPTKDLYFGLNFKWPKNWDCNRVYPNSNEDAYITNHGFRLPITV